MTAGGLFAGGLFQGAASAGAELGFECAERFSKASVGGRSSSGRGSARTVPCRNLRMDRTGLCS